MLGKKNVGANRDTEKGHKKAEKKRTRMK